MLVRKLGWLLMVAGVMSMAAGCGASVSSYVKPGASWSVIKRVAILPFQLPSENPVQRQLVTELFSEELHRASVAEVVDVPLSSPMGSGLEDLRQVAKGYKVDAVITGSIDETHGTVIHVQVQDAATDDLLWSGTYLLGIQAEFLSFRTQQQQFKRGFERLVKQWVGETYRTSS